MSLDATLVTSLAVAASSVATILGGAVAFLFVRQERLLVERRDELRRSRRREDLCDERADVHRRRVLLLWKTLLQMSRDSGHPIDTELDPAMRELDDEESAIDEKARKELE